LRYQALSIPVLASLTCAFACSSSGGAGGPDAAAGMDASTDTSRDGADASADGGSSHDASDADTSVNDSGSVDSEAGVGGGDASDAQAALYTCGSPPGSTPNDAGAAAIIPNLGFDPTYTQDPALW
jgi:hypothetical protein